MAQITTYARPEPTEHDKRAAAERLREFGPKPKNIPVVQEPTVDEKTQRQTDMDRLADLVLEHEKGKTTFYTGMKMAFGAALKDMDRSLEAANIARRLGINSPITAGVMGVGEGSGVIQDRIRFVEAILATFAKRYRATGFIDKDNFESPVGT